MRRRFLIFGAAAALLITTIAQAQTEFPPYANQNSTTLTTPPPAKNQFQVWLQNLANEAVASGISAPVVQNALSHATLDEDVIERDQNQPENTQTFATYSANTVSANRIAEGRAQILKHSHLLNEISQRYGVPPEIIVALWGMESNFGRHTGGYNIIVSMVTLAYEGRRAEFFRGQVLNGLRILDQEHMPVTELRGSWAGAMGQCQFMPSTYLKYAVDYDGDGRRDIWHSTPDVFASIANYLAAEGWKPELSWGRPVFLKKPLPETMIGLNATRPLSEWEQYGVRSTNGNPLPKQPIPASLVQPDGLEGRSFLVYDNFRALMRWNRSTYFAASVGLLADHIRQ